MMLAAGAYGAGRGYVSDFLNEQVGKISGNLPASIFGNFADEAVMLGLSWSLWKGKLPFVNVRLPGVLRGKMARDIGMAGVIIESARIGENFSGFLPGGMTPTKKAAPSLTATAG